MKGTAPVGRMRRVTSGLALCLGACVAGPSIEGVGPAETAFDAPFADVWQATLTVLTDINLPIANMERASGFLRTDEMLIEEGFGPYELEEIADCGSEVGIARTSSGATYLTVTIRVRESSDGLVATTVQTAFTNYEEDALGDESVRCASTGAVEGLFLDEIEDEVLRTR